MSSDDDDLEIVMTAPPPSQLLGYAFVKQEMWRAASEDLARLLREDVTLPLDPRKEDVNSVYRDVDIGLVLPLWHCPFFGCAACGRTISDTTEFSYEYDWWNHIWAENSRLRVFWGAA